MKTFNKLALLVTVALLTFACSSQMKLINSSVVPAATGSVKVKQDKNKNYGIEVEVRNLAQPDQLTPSRSHYVVWMDAQNVSAKKLGLMRISSKGLKGSLSTVSAQEPKKIFITAEKDEDVRYPSSFVVFSTDK
ncbi:hypothetical protein CLV98_11830 [Dyadobacter jejuensis]|uniref:Anti-sigma-K factor rskA n=1 Tax=Dyadobacter jejuensis TaxID=1082580 RepID=A0A316AAN7_9BACT|nr:hypothetical protein [Dyadobacter jejuensis]PWJ54268.1 hypothetical protein CLV98_11830 [Dyadobacter jejuensis]